MLTKAILYARVFSKEPKGKGKVPERKVPGTEGQAFGLPRLADPGWHIWDVLV